MAPKRVPGDDDIDPIRQAWRTNNRVTCLLVENMPAAIWSKKLPGEQRRTVRALCAHLHNIRCRWLKTLGTEHGLKAPELCDAARVTPSALLRQLGRSSTSMEALLTLGLTSSGMIPPSKRYTWRNLPLDVPHVLTYFVAHEAHHRGQLLMVARQLGHRLPAEVANGLWMWTHRVRETR